MSASSSSSSTQVPQHDGWIVPKGPNQPCPINALPEELLQHIFSYLPSVDQSKAALVCKTWLPNVRQAAWDRVTRIDPSVWAKYVNLEKYGLSFEGSVDLSREVLEPVALDLARRVEEGKGVSIIAIPGGLSFSKLFAIAKERGVPVRFIWEEVVPAIGARETERPCIAVISNSVLEGSKGKTIEARDALVQAMGYEVPSTIELLTVMVFHYIMHSRRLYSSEPWTYSLTSDSSNGLRLSIGGFASSGFSVSLYDDVFLGVGGLRKF
ncbi:MAG: F-box protein [Verrucomicrobia bacterium]|nr:F-box protein [Verrucomicrobiota bacterium]